MPAPVIGAAKPKGAPKSGGIGGKKIGGIPVVVIAGGVVVAIAIGLYLRNKSAAAATTTAATPLADTGADTGGATASPDSSSTDTGLADAINGLTYYLSGGGGTIDSTGGATNNAALNDSGGGPTSQAGSVIDPYTGTNINLAGYPTNTSYADLGVTPDAIVGPGPVILDTSNLAAAPIPVATTNFAEAAVQKSNAVAATGKTPAFGGVASTVTNKKTGVTTTTYASGRVVQQAPGKTAYVAKK